MRETGKTISKEPRLNHRIRVPQVRLIAEDGVMIGVVSIAEALKRAENVNLDLVEVAPEGHPPVCKILDYGKMRFEERKKKAAARKKQKTLEKKELQFRLKIEEHDYQVKLRRGLNFLESGHKVRVVLRFRGRELRNQEIGQALMARIVTDLSSVGKPEIKPLMEGRSMVASFVPIVGQKPVQSKKSVESLNQGDVQPNGGEAQ